MSRALESGEGAGRSGESRIRNRSIPPPVADALLRFLYFIPVGVQPDQKHSAVCMGTPIHLWYFGRGRVEGGCVEKAKEGEGGRIHRRGGSGEDERRRRRRTDVPPTKIDYCPLVRSFVRSLLLEGMVEGWCCVGWSGGGDGWPRVEGGRGNTNFSPSNKIIIDE